MAENEAGAAAVAPSAPSPPALGTAPSWSVNGRRALHPGIQCESLMSLWAFLIRVCICVCQMLSVERQWLVPQLHAHRPANPLSPSLPSPLSPLLCPFLQCQSQQPQQCNGPQWSNGRLLLSMSLRYQLRTVGSTTECVYECECVFTPILMPALTHIRCGNCDCALHLERMQKQTFYLSNICCMFSSFFFAASVDKQPKPWQLESGVYTDRDRDMDRDRETSADFAQTVHKLIICRCK